MNDRDVATVTDIDPLALDEEFQRTPADFAFWSHKLSEATKTSLRAKFERDRVGAKLLIEMRETLGKKTVDEIEARVTTHPDFVEAKLAEIDAEAERAKLWGVVESLRVKRDMLIQMGAHVRAEMEHDPQLRETRGKRSLRVED